MTVLQQDGSNLARFPFLGWRELRILVYFISRGALLAFSRALCNTDSELVLLVLVDIDRLSIHLRAWRFFAMIRHGHIVVLLVDLEAHLHVIELRGHLRF